MSENFALEPMNSNSTGTSSGALFNTAYETQPAVSTPLVKGVAASSPAQGWTNDATSAFPTSEQQSTFSQFAPLYQSINSMSNQDLAGIVINLDQQSSNVYAFNFNNLDPSDWNTLKGDMQNATDEAQVQAALASMPHSMLVNAFDGVSTDAIEQAYGAYERSFSSQPQGGQPTSGNPGQPESQAVQNFSRLSPQMQAEVAANLPDADLRAFEGALPAADMQMIAGDLQNAQHPTRNQLCSEFLKIAQNPKTSGDLVAAAAAVPSTDLQSVINDMQSRQSGTPSPEHHSGGVGPGTLLLGGLAGAALLGAGYKYWKNRNSEPTTDGGEHPVPPTAPPEGGEHPVPPTAPPEGGEHPVPAPGSGDGPPVSDGPADPPHISGRIANIVFPGETGGATAPEPGTEGPSIDRYVVDPSTQTSLKTGDGKSIWAFQAEDGSKHVVVSGDYPETHLVTTPEGNLLAYHMDEFVPPDSEQYSNLLRETQDTIGSLSWAKNGGVLPDVMNAVSEAGAPPAKARIANIVFPGETGGAIQTVPETEGPSLDRYVVVPSSQTTAKTADGKDIWGFESLDGSKHMVISGDFPETHLVSTADGRMLVYQMDKLVPQADANYANLLKQAQETAGSVDAVKTSGVLPDVLEAAAEVVHI